MPTRKPSKKAVVGFKAPSKKVAMVAPPPTKDKPANPAEPQRLEAALSTLGEGRSYFIISHHGDTWEVFFTGDEKPKTIALVNSKWVIA